MTAYNSSEDNLTHLCRQQAACAFLHMPCPALAALPCPALPSLQWLMGAYSIGGRGGWVGRMAVMHRAFAENNTPHNRQCRTMHKNNHLLSYSTSPLIKMLDQGRSLYKLIQIGGGISWNTLAVFYDNWYAAMLYSDWSKLIHHFIQIHM